MDAYAVDVPDEHVSVIHTPGCITLCALGRPIMVRSDDAKRYANVLDLLRQRRLADAFTAAQPDTPLWVLAARSLSLKGFTVSIEKDALIINGVEQPTATAKYLDTLLILGLDVTNVMMLLARLEQNPSYNARQQLMEYIINKRLPITDDGHFLAYKSVKADLWDHYTGETFHHPIGAEIKMPRRDVDDNPSHDCSRGAHFADYDYMRHYSDNGIICVLKVDPADVVTIADHGTKGRACRYVVIGHFNEGRDAARDVVQQNYPAAPPAETFVIDPEVAKAMLPQVEILTVVEEEDLNDDQEGPEDQFLDGTYEGE